MSRALTQHGLKAAVKTDACSTLVSLNIFAGTEHGSANYSKVQESFRKHTAETANKGRAPPKSGVKYSREVNGKKIAWIENNPLSLKDLTNYKKVAAYIADHIGEVYTIFESGSRVYIGENLPSEYTQSEYTRALLRKSPKTLTAKNKAIGSFGEMIEIATNRRWEKTKHIANKDAKYGVYRYSTAFAFPVKQNNKITNIKSFDAELVILNSSDGKKYLYDIVNIKENTADELDLMKRDQIGGQDAPARRGASKGSIPNTSENVKKYSAEPTEGTDAKTELVEKQTLIDANTGKYIARNINGEHFGLTDDPSKAITEERDIERAWASTKFMRKKGITLETATVTREVQKREPYHPPKVDSAQRTQEKQRADDFEQSVKGSYFYSHSRKNLTPYYRVGNDVIINRTAAIELFVRAAKKMGALERHHSSRNGSKYSSSVYLVLDGTELRISDHELPYNAIRDNTRTRWDGEIILDDYTLREMVKLKSEKEYTEWVKECFESPERSDRTADYMPAFSREPESITELRRQNETMLAQATNEDAANDNERGLIKDYKRQYDKVSGIVEKLNTARQEVLTAERSGGGNTTAKKKIKKHRTHCPVFGRGRRLRTLGLRFWRPPLYQLSYSPIKLVGLQGLEPQTDRL